MSKRIVRNIFENVNDENIALTSEISTKLSYKDLKLFINKILVRIGTDGTLILPTYKNLISSLETSFWSFIHWLSNLDGSAR